MHMPVERQYNNRRLFDVPVQAYKATDDHDIHLNQLHVSCGCRVRYKRVFEKDRARCGLA